MEGKASSIRASSDLRRAQARFLARLKKFLVKRLLPASHLSVCSSQTTLLPLDKFSRYIVLVEFLLKSVDQIQVRLKSGKIKKMCVVNYSTFIGVYKDMRLSRRDRSIVNDLNIAWRHINAGQSGQKSESARCYVIWAFCAF